MDLRIRSATIQDSRNLLEWRNEAGVREYSHDPGLISKQRHEDWLVHRLRLLSIEPFWIFENELGNIGFVRFDLNVALNYFEVSIIVNPLFRGMGYGRIILNRAIEKCLAEHSGVSFLAEAHENNQASKKLFINSGFKEVGHKKNFLVFKRTANLN
jgi:RimJ/RimL family protein N-acetyltransferase